MADVLRVHYGQTGRSTETDGMGMREMQARAYESRDSQFLLLKAPPASGKSRGLMYIALDKLVKQGLRKAIVSVPEMAVGASFKNENLTAQGFFADWVVQPRHNLCTPGTDYSKVQAFVDFMLLDSDELADRTLVCTHATLRFAYKELEPEAFNDCVIAIDEFHHVSADEGNQLGHLLDSLMHHSTAHVVAMTGSYFRGDTVPILSPEDEARFDKVTYTYYEQLNGYEHLKSLGIGYHFYQGSYIDAIGEVLDVDQKTIVHIPNVNSAESTKAKHLEVDHILDVLGTVVERDPETQVLRVRTREGRILKVANLVDDDPRRRAAIVSYLRDVAGRDDMDIIIALGMAKEGFDWPWCEHVLTIGYRQSMTEVVQIIGRATRDAPGKPHAQFTNLIAEPKADGSDVKEAVNNMLKAISVSLLMEQVMAPSFKFTPREPGEPFVAPGVIRIDSATSKPSQRVLDALDNSGQDLIAELLRGSRTAATALDPGVDDQVLSRVELPQVIQHAFPDFDSDEKEHMRQGLSTLLAAGSGGGVYAEEDLPEDAEFERPEHGGGTDSKDNPDPAEKGGRYFLKMQNKFVNIMDLNIDMIQSVNPFRGAYEILSKSVTAPMLRTIHDEIVGRRIAVSEEETVIVWPKIKAFVTDNQREPSLTASDPVERRYAEVLTYLRGVKRERATAARG